MSDDPGPQPGGLRHDALLHAGDSQFVSGATAFVRRALDHGQPAVVAVTSRKVGLLRDALGARAGEVHFTAVDRLGRNPARLLSAWCDLVARYGAPDACVHAVGEWAWPDRTEAELTECRHHEALVEVALGGARTWLRCAYDTAALAPPVIEGAWATHAALAPDGGTGTKPSDRYRGPAGVDDAWTEPLPPPPRSAVEMAFGATGLGDTRRATAAHALAAGLDPGRVDDLMVAVAEVAANTVLHAGGAGTLRLWVDDGAVVCEVRDPGHVTDRLAGRRRPASGWDARGLWLVNELCDLVQVRSSPAGTAVRIHMWV